MVPGLLLLVLQGEASPEQAYEGTDMNNTKTPGQRFAEQYGSKAVEEMLSAIKMAKRIALGLTVLVLIASFQHQRAYLLSLKCDEVGAVVIPVVIDLMILLCVKVLSAAGMAAIAKKISIYFLVVPVGASATINFLGSPNATVGSIYAFVVSCIAMVEIIKAFIRPDFRLILAEEERVQPAAEIGQKLSPAERATRNAKRNLTIERKRIMALRLPELRAEAAGYGIDPEGMRKPSLQIAVVHALELDTPAPVSPAPAGARA